MHEESEDRVQSFPLNLQEVVRSAENGLDVQLAASGFKHTHQAVLERYTPARDGEAAEHNDEHNSESVADSDEASSCTSAELALDSTEDELPDDGSALADRQSVHAAHEDLRSPTSESDAEQYHHRGLSPSQETAREQDGQQAPATCSAAELAAETSLPQQMPLRPHALSSSQADTGEAQASTGTGLHEALTSGCVASVTEDDDDDGRSSVFSHAQGLGHSNERLGRVRAQLAAERKSQQKQHIQNRAAKGARQAAARAGRKAVSQNM